ncbi:olfactory receptor 6N1-like [Lepisosteus oculatus]|uniref:olfactory receptor 6N1-like n=1 Tax=Lepisosteus oculatus TaxID=7918 RepID=UPI0035F52451
MSDSNRTLHYEFIIVGLPGLQEHYTALFIFFLFLFLVTILGNLLIVLLVALDHRLHTPMYFFLWNLSLLDILLTCTVIPKLLAILLCRDNTISFSGCFAQMYFFMTLPAAEGFLLAAMSYDRYTAIVKPLHYNTIINTKVCLIMTVTVWVLGILAPLPSIILASMFPYCKSNFILHIVCDYPTVMALACGDITAQVQKRGQEEVEQLLILWLSRLMPYSRTPVGTNGGVHRELDVEEETASAAMLGERRRLVICHCCGERGHIAQECWALETRGLWRLSGNRSRAA